MKLKHLLILIALCISHSMFAQERISITGKVVDEQGEALIGATVMIEGTDEGVGTDMEGEFALHVKNGDVLHISYVFYEDQRIRVEKGKKRYVIALQSESNIMDDVIVIAYGTASKESVTGAISVVDSKEISKRPSANVLTSLEGSSAGIQVNNSYGQPGSVPSVRIRGFTTINGSNSPLYVVDGVPFTGNISNINPNDVESMSVLKDASASTLYGNRASNGVIIITTKKASSSGNYFNVSLRQGLYNKGIKEYDRLGDRDFMNVMREGYRNSLLSNGGYTLEEANLEANRGLISDILGLNIYNLANDQLFDENGQLRRDAQMLEGYAGDLDWNKPIFRTGFYQEGTMSGSVGGEKGGAYFSLGMLNNDGYFKKSEYKRLSARAKADYEVTDWLKVGLNLSGAHINSSGLQAGTDNSGLYVNPFMFSRFIAPIYPVHEHDLVTGDYLYDEEGNRIYDNGSETRKQYVGRHVIWENELNQHEFIRNTMKAQIYTDIKLHENLTLTLKGDMELGNSEERKYDNAVIGDGNGNNGRSKRDIYREKAYTAQQLLNWKKSYKDHNFDVLLGHENYNNDYSYLYGRKSNEVFKNNPNWNNFTENGDMKDYPSVYRTEGYFTRMKYNYKNKYFLEGSFRKDGSSKFQSDYRWGDFWSVGGSWIVSKEDFFKVRGISDLKIRASYGQVGNDVGAGWYAYKALYGINKNGSESALYKTQNESPTLVWESLNSTDLGLEFGLFDNRINFVLEYFNKESTNLLFNLNYPLSTGSTSTSSAKSVVTANMGSIENKGFELTFDADIIRTPNWNWNFNLNATWLKNKITKLPEENRENGIVSGTKKYVEGRSIYDFYLYQYAGVDQMTGDALYQFDHEVYTVDGSDPDKKTISQDEFEKFITKIGENYYSKNVTYARKDWSGSSIPDVYGSFGTSLSHKNFTLSALFTYSLGGKVYDYTYADLMAVSASPSAIHKDILNAWKGVPEGMTKDAPNRIDPNGTPVVDFTRNNYSSSTSTRLLMDRSYLTIKNISLNYTMPSDFIQRIGVRELSFNVGIENLATFSKLRGMDVQQSFDGIVKNGYVAARTYTFGINIGL